MQIKAGPNLFKVRQKHLNRSLHVSTIMTIRILGERSPLLEKKPLFERDESRVMENSSIQRTDKYRLGLYIYQWDTYCVGYKHAADLVVENSSIGRLNYDRYYNLSRSINVLVLPAVFLYRQYLELRLKSIRIKYKIQKSIHEYNKIPNEVEIDLLFERNFYKHDISTSWNKCKEIIEELNQAEHDTDDSKELDVMGQYIKEFSDLDKTSYAFRYPIDTNGKLISYKTHSFSIKRLCKTMNEIYLYLEEQNLRLNAIIECEEEGLQEIESIPCET